jgi:hypothetical protein
METCGRLFENDHHKAIFSETALMADGSQENQKNFRGQRNSLAERTHRLPTTLRRGRSPEPMFDLLSESRTASIPPLAVEHSAPLFS